MTHFYSCQIELQDSLYFATREIGRLYETEPILHNYALCYALGLVDNPLYNTVVAETDSYRYFCPEQVPKYQEHLTPLNKQNIYVTPAYAVYYAATLNTWKYANNNYHVEMEKMSKNIPGFGRTKEVTPESVFEFFVICDHPLKLPRWIRLGKWMSKAELKMQELTKTKEREGIFTYRYCLNPLDVMFTNQIISYDVVNMPPVSLIRNVTMRGKYYEFDGRTDLKIPVQMSYHFSHS